MKYLEKSFSVIVTGFKSKAKTCYNCDHYKKEESKDRCEKCRGFNEFEQNIDK